MPSNARDYAKRLREAVKELPDRVFMPRFRKFAFKVLEGAINLSPVNFGQLRAGWHVTIDGPSGADNTEGRQSYPGSGQVMQAGLTLINRADFGQRIYLQNNVPHAPIIEFGLFSPRDPGPSKATHVPKTRRKRVAGTVLVRGGYHVSAPRGMLGDSLQVAMQEFQSGAI